jgi:pimeloyl-ACP methyl ester carboxylesterase
VLSFPRRLVTVLAPALLLAGLVASAGPAAASTGTTACPSPILRIDKVLCGSLADGATYLIEVPAHWNHTLFLYSHGYVVPGSANPAQDVGDPATGGWLLSHGFALAGSSYAITGWALAFALPDQIATLDTFDKMVGKPSRTIAWGHSLGGMITAGLIQRYPRRFNAALPMCGVLSGGIATWNTALDAAFAFQQLVDKSVHVTGITDPTTNLRNAEGALATAQGSMQGQARLALAAALGDTPGWFTPLSPEPAATDYTTQELNQFQWEANVDFPFIFAFRAQLEALAGGNPSWNTGVNYAAQLAKSADFREVRALYKKAGLSLRDDLRTLNKATRISADPAAARYLESNIVYNGKISVPVLTMHTIGDGLVVPENEQAYASVVRRAGNSALLRQIFVSRAGHCAFTPAETITAARVLLNRLRTGSWNDDALFPRNLNTSAANLGPNYNIFVSGSTVVPVAPAFMPFHPAPYLRPFDWQMRLHP